MTAVAEFPLPSDRDHRSSGDCLEGKKEDYQVCSVQYGIVLFVSDISVFVLKRDVKLQPTCG